MKPSESNTAAYAGEVSRIGQSVVISGDISSRSDIRIDGQMEGKLYSEGRVVIGSYNLDDENDFASENRVMSLPTILFFKDGKKTPLRLAGSQSRETLVEKIEALLAL